MVLRICPYSEKATHFSNDANKNDFHLNYFTDNDHKDINPEIIDINDSLAQDMLEDDFDFIPPSPEDRNPPVSVPEKRCRNFTLI